MHQNDTATNQHQTETKDNVPKQLPCPSTTSSVLSPNTHVPKPTPSTSPTSTSPPGLPTSLPLSPIQPQQIPMLQIHFHLHIHNPTNLPITLPNLQSNIQSDILSGLSSTMSNIFLFFLSSVCTAAVIYTIHMFLTSRRRVVENEGVLNALNAERTRLQSPLGVPVKRRGGSGTVRR